MAQRESKLNKVGVFKRLHKHLMKPNGTNRALPHRYGGRSRHLLILLVPLSLLSACLCCCALFSSLMTSFCLHICLYMAHCRCLQMVALTYRSIKMWLFSSYFPHRSNANPTFPISNSWVKESEAA